MLSTVSSADVLRSGGVVRASTPPSLGSGDTPADQVDIMAEPIG